MERLTLTIDELNAAVSAAVNAALDAREKAHRKVYLSRKETARRLGKDVSTLWRWAQTGYLTPIHRGGRVVYAENDVMRIERGESAL